MGCVHQLAKEINTTLHKYFGGAQGAVILVHDVPAALAQKRRKLLSSGLKAVDIQIA